MRARIREVVVRAWWTVLAAAGLPRERWDAVPRLWRRGITAAIWLAIGLVLVALFGVWKTSALAIAVFVILLVVPRWERLTVRGYRVGKWITPAAILGAAIAYPYYVGDLPQVPIFGPFPQLSTMVVMMIFTMMALGLNFVVGYAGLLDLGYVAFYAMGAYMAGWFASNQFAKQNVDFGAVGLYKGATGFHFSIWLVLLTIFCSARLRDSRLGRAWIAIREDEVAAAAMGVPLMRTKTWAYATGAFFGGVAGAFYASFKSATFPGDFFFNISVFILCMVILGVVLGASFLAYLDREGLANIGGWLNTHFGPGGSTVGIWSTPIDVPKYEFGIFGIILLVVMLFRPEGLIPSSRRAAEFHEGVADQPLYDVTH